MTPDKTLALLALPVMSLALTGCIGTDSTPTDEQIISTTAGANETYWHHETWNGTAEGIGAVWIAYPTDPAVRQFQVPNGTQHLYMNLTKGDPEVWFQTYAPDCEDPDAPVTISSGNESGPPPCGQHHDDGQVSEAGPTPGSWRVNITRNEPGQGSSHFTLKVAMKLPANVTR